MAIFASIQFIAIPTLAVAQKPLAAGFLYKFVIFGTLGLFGAVYLLYLQFSWDRF